MVAITLWPWEKSLERPVIRWVPLLEIVVYKDHTSLLEAGLRNTGILLSLYKSMSLVCESPEKSVLIGLDAGHLYLASDHIARANGSRLYLTVQVSNRSYPRSRCLITHDSWCPIVWQLFIMVHYLLSVEGHDYSLAKAKFA